jgi:hypothetical protein
MDIYSRLAKDRILLLGTDVNDEMANNLVAQVVAVPCDRGALHFSSSWLIFVFAHFSSSRFSDALPSQ